MKIIGVYCLRNTINDKLYIGSSIDIKKRIKTHFYRLKSGKHRNKHLQYAYNKYGKEAFMHYILEECPADVRIRQEQIYIDRYDFNKLYNMDPIAGAGGGATLRNPLYIIDLRGRVVKQVASGVEAAEYFNIKLLTYSYINTKAIYNKKYRIVTPSFYRNNYDIIKSWKFYVSKPKFLTKYKLSWEGESPVYYNTLDEMVEVTGLSKERVSDIVNRKRNHVFLQIKRVKQKV